MVIAFCARGGLGRVAFVTILAVLVSHIYPFQAVIDAQKQQPQRPSASRDRWDEVLFELKAIRLLLEELTSQAERTVPGPTTAPPTTARPATPPPPTPPRPQTVRIDDMSGYTLGSPSAPLTMVEFSDLHCPFCRQYFSTSFQKLRTEWIETGRLRYIVKDLPLRIHPGAVPAAVAVRCAGKQQRFWDLRETLLIGGASFSEVATARAATTLNLDAEAFRRCTADASVNLAVKADAALAQRLGIDATPSFIIGRTTSDYLEGTLVTGAVPYEIFHNRLISLLGAQ